MKNRKILLPLTILISMSFFNFSYVTNATGGNISFDYSNYNGDQSLKISGGIDAKIDQMLVKKFEDSDYYNQFRFLKDLSSKVIAVSNKSPSKKDLFSELANYLSLKSDLLYKVSKIENSSDVTSIKNTFKNSIKTKGVTLNTVIEKVNSTGKVEITNDNDNFSKLSEKDFEKEMVKLVDDSKVNKYKTYNEIIVDTMQPIKTSYDFEKIKSYLPASVKFTDEFGNDIYGDIDKNWAGYDFENKDFNTKANQILSKFGNLSVDDLLNLKISGKDTLYNVLGDDNLIVNFLNKIKVNKQLTTDSGMHKEVNSMGNKGELYGYGITPLGGILKYGNKFDLSPRIELFLNKNGNSDLYLKVGLQDYTYLGNSKNGDQQYIIIDMNNNKLSFGKSGKSGIDGRGIINDTNSNINIVFDDGTTLNNKDYEFSLDDFKKVINKKVKRINIDGEEINSGLLLEKGSIINLYK